MHRPSALSVLAITILLAGCGTKSEQVGVSRRQAQTGAAKVPTTTESKAGKPVPVEGKKTRKKLVLSLIPRSVSVDVGTEQAFTAFITHPDGTKEDVTARVAFSSGDPAVALFDAVSGRSEADAQRTPPGVALAVGDGSAAVVATLDGSLTAEAALSVKIPTNEKGPATADEGRAPSRFKSLTIAPVTWEAAFGETQQFLAVAEQEDGQKVDVTRAPNIVWSAGTIGRVGEPGAVSAVAAGSGKVVATLRGLNLSASAVVVFKARPPAAPETPVKPSLLSIEVSPVTVTLASGQSQTFQARATYTDNSTKAIDCTSWRMYHAPSVGSVTSAGAVIASAALSTDGTDWVYCTHTEDGVTRESYSTVQFAAGELPPPPAAKTLSSVTVSPSVVDLFPNGTADFTATASFSDGSSAAVACGQWKMYESSSIASVTASGRVTAPASLGSDSTDWVYCYHTLDGVTLSSWATVNFRRPADVPPPARTLTGVSVSPAAVSLQPGYYQDFQATAAFSDGTTAVVSCTQWQMFNNPTLASVTTSGRVTAPASIAAATTDWVYCHHTHEGVTKSAFATISLKQPDAPPPPVRNDLYIGYDGPNGPIDEQDAFVCAPKGDMSGSGTLQGLTAQGQVSVWLKIGGRTSCANRVVLTRGGPRGFQYLDSVTTGTTAAGDVWKQIHLLDGDVLLVSFEGSGGCLRAPHGSTENGIGVVVKPTAPNGCNVPNE